MSKQMMVIAVVVVLILLGGAYFMMNQSSTTPTTPAIDTTIENTTPATQPETTGTGSATTGVVKEFTITSSGLKFTPATLTVDEGDTVKITYKNGGGTHDWSLDEFNVATKTLNSGEEETVTFVASKAGTYEYYCSIMNHRQMGMKGTLTVQ